MSVSNTLESKRLRRDQRAKRKADCTIPTLRMPYMTRFERRALAKRRAEWLQKLKEHRDSQH